MKTWTAGEARQAMAEAPVVDLDALCPPGVIAVVAPHPDDEALGCGGLIALAAQRGRTVLVAILTDGARSHPGSRAYPPGRLAAVRAEEARAAAALLGGDRVVVERFGAADGRLADVHRGAADWLTERLRVHGASTVFVTWDADPHPDHKAAHAAAATAARALGLRLWAYPVWGLVLQDQQAAGVARPVVRLDVRAVLDRKAAAIAAHRSQTSDLISDDEQGFRLSADDIARHLADAEPYLLISDPGAPPKHGQPDRACRPAPGGES